MSGYASWSVVFGEQPSAAKWNILGTNDADFDTRTTIKRQDDTSNSDKTNPRILTGWGVIVPGATTVGNETVTFGLTFAQRPIVVISSGGDNAAGTLTLGAGTAAVNNFYAEAHTVTTTGFSARVISASAWDANDSAFYHWIAIGEV